LINTGISSDPVRKEIETLDENKGSNLTMEQLSEVSGGGAKKGYETVSCPHCGAEKDVYYKPGKKITCSACGKEFEI